MFTQDKEREVETRKKLSTKKYDQHYTQLSYLRGLEYANHFLPEGNAPRRGLSRLWY